MDGEQPVDVLEELLAVRGKHLLHTAVLLAGSQEDGEDLLQAALERVFRRWRTIRGNPEGYLRRTLYHLAADGWRRKQAWRARLGVLGQPGAQPDDTGAVDNQDQLLRLLRQLPPRQRTAIDLWEYGAQDRQLDDSANGQPMWETWTQTGHGYQQDHRDPRAWREILRLLTRLSIHSSPRGKWSRGSPNLHIMRCCRTGTENIRIMPP
jgi:hypothetical protein